MSRFWSDKLDEVRKDNDVTTDDITSAIGGVAAAVRNGLSSDQLSETLANGGGASLTISPSTATVGTELTASLPSTYGATSYQWMRTTISDGVSTTVDISGETSSTYTLTPSDGGKEITCKANGVFVISSGVSVEIDESEPVLAKHSFIAFGDSFTHNGAAYRSDNGTYTLKSVGYWVWANMLTESQFQMVDHAGVSGNKTSDMLLRMDDVLLSGASVVIVLAGTNDLPSGRSVSDIASDMLNIVTQIVNNGQYVVLCPVAHRADSNSDENPNIDILNAAYASIAASLDNCFYVPEYTEFNDAIDNGDSSDVTIDDLHPNTRGAYLIGKNIAETMDSNFNSYLGDITNLLPNPEFDGTDGVVQYGSTGVSPTSWVIQFADPTDGVGGGEYGSSVSDGVWTIRTGAVSQTNRALVKCANVTVEPNESYALDFELTINDTSLLSTLEIKLSTEDSEVGATSTSFNIPSQETTTATGTIRVTAPPINVGSSTYVQPQIQINGTNIVSTLTNPRLYKLI